MDDLYNSLITQLNDLIMKPLVVNLVGKHDDDVEQCISELKSVITDKISLLIKQKFFSEEMLNIWANLWQDSTSGVDSHRRRGIINAENLIAPTIEAYLKSNYTNHIVNDLENLINDCIQGFEKKLFQKT